MSIGAIEDRGDDYTSTDHYGESQDFDDLVDGKTHDGMGPLSRIMDRCIRIRSTTSSSTRTSEHVSPGSDQSRCAN